MSKEIQKIYVSYNNIHKLCQQAASNIRKLGRPDVIIAIGAGGYIPARILRTYLKLPGENNIPIQAIGLSLYESFGADGVDRIGKEVVRTQWLDFGALEHHMDSLIGKNVLLVDEVDDTRTTLHYALEELHKDVVQLAASQGRANEKTKFSVFVVHNKSKVKKAEINPSILNGGQYFVGRTVPDLWVAYPWEAEDIEVHTKNAILQGNN